MSTRLGGSWRAWRTRAGVCIVLTCTAAWYALHSPTTLIAASPIGGQLELAAGDVRVEHAGKPETTVSGMPLPDRAKITTGQGARALLRLLGGASAFLGDTTQLELIGPGISLIHGRVWLDVPALPEPVIHDLGEAKLAVTSAGLSIERHEGHLEIYVARGLAVVSAAKARREIAAGERAIIESGGNVKIEPVAFWDDWTGGMADRGLHASSGDAGSGTLYAVDRDAGSGIAARTLSVRQQNVRARIADGIAETEVDQTFWNAGDRAVEGYYWFTVPAQAIVTGFALETNGVLVEGEVVERKEALAKYQDAVQGANDPALLEWISDRTYRARIYPIPAVGTRRVVLRYVEPVAVGDGRVRWGYPMTQAGPEAPAIDEFSLSLELGALGKDSVISTLPDARVEDGGSRITVRRSVYTPRADFQVELVPKHAVAPLRATRFSSSGDQADFVMLRWVPDVTWPETQRGAAELVVAVDVSAGGDDSDRQLKAAVAEAILRNLAAGDKFAVMTTDIVPRVIYPESGLATADDTHVAAALDRLAQTSSGGATDLGALFDPGLSRLHGAEQPALVYIGDGRATSGELQGSELVERLRRSLEGARARFFDVSVGDDANHSLLERLAAVGGGVHFRVDDPSSAIPAALQLTAAIKTPTLTDLVVDVGVGLDEPLSNVAGKLARGQGFVLLARTHHDLPAQAQIRGRLDGKPFERSYPLTVSQGAATPLVPRLWAAELVRRQIGRAASAEDARSKVIALALEYGLVTPFSSVLALDSEAAYGALGIPRRTHPWDRLSNAQAQLESSSGWTTALGVALAPLSLVSGCSPKEEIRSLQPQEPAAAPQARESAAAAKAAPATAPMFADRLDTEDSTGAGSPQPTAATRDERFAERAVAAKAVEPVQARASLRQHMGSLAKLARSESAEPGPMLLAERPKDDAPRHATGYVLARVCSDVAARPLADRALLWQRRLRSAQQMQDALALYDGARAACEVPTQHDQRALLSFLPAFATNAEATELLFAHFAHDPQAVTLLARLVLRRTLDPYVAAVARRNTQGALPEWTRVDLELALLPSDDARMLRLRNLLLAAPNDIDAELRLMKLLVRSGKREEALPMAARLRERGLFSPSLLVDLGDIQLAAGLRDDALRTYTEILEFDADSAAARKLVGDTLLEHGWYDVAYRQFRTLLDQSPGNASAQIRLALAASGSGRADEALRILRAVAETDAEPGANDPRLHARLLAAALVSRLLAENSHDAARTEALTRQLKQLQVLQTPGKLCLLTWEALGDSLGFGAAAGDLVDAADVGLIALGSSEQSLEVLRSQVTLRSQHASGSRLHYKLHELSFDGKAFHVKVLDGDLG